MCGGIVNCKHKIKSALLAGILFLSAPWSSQVQAQAGWRPDKAVEIVVPTGAGGTNDVMARLVQQTLQSTCTMSIIQ